MASSSPQRSLGSTHAKSVLSPQAYSAVLMQEHSQQSPPSYPENNQTNIELPATHIIELGFGNNYTPSRRLHGQQRVDTRYDEGTTENFVDY